MLQLPPNFFRDLERSAQEDGRAFERESMKFAERLKRQGRDVVAEYLSDASKANDLTPTARDSLAKFLVEYGVTDNLRDAGARRLRDAIVHFEAIVDLLPKPKSSWRRRICALAPAMLIGVAIVTGFYEPLRDVSYRVCRFVGAANFGTYAEYDFVRLAYEPALPPIAITVVAIGFALFGGWKSFGINLFLAAAIFFGAQGLLVVSDEQEARVPAYCAIIDSTTNTTISPSLEQRLRIRSVHNQ